MVMKTSNMLPEGTSVRVLYDDLDDGVMRVGTVLTADGLGLWIEDTADVERMIPWPRVVELEILAYNAAEVAR